MSESMAIDPVSSLETEDTFNNLPAALPGTSDFIGPKPSWSEFPSLKGMTPRDVDDEVYEDDFEKEVQEYATQQNLALDEITTKVETLSVATYDIVLPVLEKQTSTIKQIEKNTGNMQSQIASLERVVVHLQERHELEASTTATKKQSSCIGLKVRCTELRTITERINCIGYSRSPSHVKEMIANMPDHHPQKDKMMKAMDIFMCISE